MLWASCIWRLYCEMVYWSVNPRTRRSLHNLSVPECMNAGWRSEAKTRGRAFAACDATKWRYWRHWELHAAAPAAGHDPVRASRARIARLAAVKICPSITATIQNKIHYSLCEQMEVDILCTVYADTYCWRTMSSGRVKTCFSGVCPMTQATRSVCIYVCMDVCICMYVCMYVCTCMLARSCLYIFFKLVTCACCSGSPTMWKSSYPAPVFQSFRQGKRRFAAL